jgi:succinate dehydrogenase/fumarate reductase flavoprotein subunit
MPRKSKSERFDADVLIIGGGLAGCWAAVSAARQGARVILAEKGYCGTSGVTATAGPGHWWVPPDSAIRADAIRRRMQTAYGLADPEWMARIIDTTWRTLPTISQHYDFSQDEKGEVHYRALRGPEYMRAMRKLVEESGVTIFDQSPALELVVKGDGAVGGVRLYRRQLKQEVTVRAGAVVLASGGCAFLAHLLGSGTNTGEGYLMAAEAGAELSGMEFSAYHTVAPVFSNMTRSMSYAFATYSDASGRELDIPFGPDTTRSLARAMLQGPVYCHLGRMPQDVRAVLPNVSPNFMLPFTRKGIDPFTQAFEVTLRGEGTVRGTGGLRITSDDCATTVPGLYAAGDAATRELIAGATSGGGNQNSAWALSSGIWSGQGAARYARGAGRDRAKPAEARGHAGFASWPGDTARPAEVIAAVQAEMLPFDKIIFRSGAKLSKSRQALDQVWTGSHGRIRDQNDDIVRSREAAAMVATARWCLSSALAREESRGLHQRDDRPEQDARFASRIAVGGLDKVWTRLDDAPQAAAGVAAA